MSKHSSKLMYFISLAFFLVVIFTPPVYILSYAFKSQFVINEASRTALFNSLVIGFVVTLFDLVFGLPVAWVLARRKSLKHRHLIDTLIDMPLVVPTSVLGLSVYFFWGGGLGSLFGVQDGLISKGPIMIILLHIVFSFPYVVRSIEAAVFQIDKSHEQAATMLGASQFTVFRTISLPLFKAGVISGAILAFTRSLSETGATMMVAGLTSTAPTIVVDYKKAGDITSAAAISVVLIGIAVVLLVLTKILSKSFRVPVTHVWPSEERTLSKEYVHLRDMLVSFFVMAIILVPTFYIALSGLGVLRSDTISSLLRDGGIMNSIIVSFAVAFIVTVVNLAFSMPLSMVISRNKFKIGGVIDTMSDVILLVPTSALGLSLSMFWGNFSFNEFMILVLAHMSFSMPLMLKPISAALSGVDPNLEDAARTLGAKPLKVFMTITYPLIKPGIVAGIIMTFMRSLSETGATLSVSDNIKTIPVLLVDLFNAHQVDDKAILASIVLFALSFVFILVLKSITNKNAKH
ncbi:MAG: iron ABC transporter permease [Candidatus Altiarchaeota archaeon]|nr:iron ABC transporter permease [Candidatus Altiarchaeota archaeon]